MAERRIWPPALREHLPTLSGGLTVFFVLACAGCYIWRNLIATLPYVLSARSDFTNYLAAARAVSHGGSPFLVPQFDYPPLLAFLLIPLASLSNRSAHVCWLVVNHLALLAAAVLTWRRSGRDRAAALATAAVWGLAGTVAENLALGQLNPLLVLLVVLWWPGRASGVGRGSFLGLAGALKVWPLTLVAVDLGRRRWRAAATAVGVAVVMTVAPMAVVALALSHPWLPSTARYWAGTPALLNFSLPAVALRAAEPPAADGPLPPGWIFGNDPQALRLSAASRSLSIGAAVATLALGALLLRRVLARPLPDDVAPLTAGAVLSVTLAAAPIAWYHYQLVLFPWLAVMFARLLRQRRHLALAFGAVLVLALTWNGAAGIGTYVACYGWTAARPWLLWTLTTFPPVFNLVLAVLFVRVGESAVGSG